MDTLKGPADMLQYYEQSYQRALQTYAIEQQGRRRRDEYQEGVYSYSIKITFTINKEIKNVWQI